MIRKQPEPITVPFDLRGVQDKLQAAVVGGFMVLAVMLGGSSASGLTANALLEVAAVIAIGATFGWSPGTERARPDRQLLLFIGVLAALYVVQSIPLPPAVWSALPGRALVVRGLGALGQPLPWMPLSLAPGKTLQSGLALLPPTAMIAMIGAFHRQAARVAIFVLVAAVILSVLLGVAQAAGSSRLYLYTYSNFGSAVGFFANANHFGTLMCATIPLAAGLVARWRSAADGTHGASRTFAIALLLGIVLLALLGIIMTRSVAAVLLAVLAIAGSAGIVLSGLSRGLRLGFVLGIALVVLAAAGIAAFNGASDLVSTDGMTGGELSRRAMWEATAAAIGQFGIAGTGFGAFPQIFHLFENPQAIGVFFANHAHNDLLEFVLEGGIPAVVLLVIFLLWFAMRFASVWLAGRNRDPIAQGASVSALIILLHSLVDYPMRTAAIATVFGLCLALMARSAGGGMREQIPLSEASPRHVSA